MNRIVKTTNAKSLSSDFYYDANNNLTAFKDANNNIRSYQYDLLDRLTMGASNDKVFLYKILNGDVLSIIQSHVP